MPTVDLPARNVYTGSPPRPDHVGGADALATTDTDTGITLSWLGLSSFDVGRDAATGLPTLGFGLWEQPVGAAVTDVRFVALAYRGGGGDIPAEEYPADWTTPHPPLTYPFLLVDYFAAPTPGGYNLSNIPFGAYGEADSRAPIAHYIDGNDYVIAGIGAPDTGTDGLRPSISVDSNYPTPMPDIKIHLAYLAIRITYTEAGGRMPPLRQVQRPSVPRAVQNNSRQASLRSGRAFI